MDENSAAPARDASEASENINQVTQVAGGAVDSSSATAEQVAKFLGTDAATLEEFTKFTNANGKFNKAFDVFKSKISNPTPAQVQEQKPVVDPVYPAAPQEQEYRAPAGAINQNEYFIKRYFMDLASEEQYASISKEISSGSVLTEMADLGIQYMLPNGAIDSDRVNKFLAMKAQTVPAKQSGAEPEASAAPTVDYVPVGENIKTADEARQVIMQDTQLRARGMAGHPAAQKAEEFLRNLLSKGSK